jgi:hypothetical protein
MMAGFTLGIGILANKQYQDRKEFERTNNK